jgi:hypothetical protein
MVKRAQLTPKFVFEAACPAQGERWIADTKIRGFGLRLWSTKSGGQKAFALRVSNVASQKIRRTFDPEGTWRAKFPTGEDKYGLGDYLDDAREWARDEIDQIKGRLTRYEMIWGEQRAVGRLIRSMPLERAANALLAGLYTTNASESYRDRLDKLFARHVPAKIKKAPLANLNPRQVARALVKADTTAGNVRVLRSFISQIIERGASFYGPLGRFHDEFSEEFSAQWKRSRDVRYPELRRYRDEKYLELFRALESDDEYWQQAMAIRIYFAFRVPLNRILRAQWKQIHADYWYPYWPKEKKYWFECRERIDGNTPVLLDRVKRLGARDFGGSRFWFPSHYSKGTPHIRTVEHAWRRALRTSQVKYYPLREFSRSFREFNNPSYYMSFIREYGAIGREVQNAVEVSKALARSQK